MHHRQIALESILSKTDASVPAPRFGYHTRPCIRNRKYVPYRFLFPSKKVRLMRDAPKKCISQLLPHNCFSSLAQRESLKEKTLFTKKVFSRYTKDYAIVWHVYYTIKTNFCQLRCRKYCEHLRGQREPTNNQILSSRNSGTEDAVPYRFENILLFARRRNGMQGFPSGSG